MSFVIYLLCLATVIQRKCYFFFKITLLLFKSEAVFLSAAILQKKMELLTMEASQL